MPVTELSSTPSNASPATAQDKLRPFAPCIDVIIQVVVTSHKGLASAEVEVTETLLRTFRVDLLPLLNFDDHFISIEFGFGISLESSNDPCCRGCHSFHLFKHISWRLTWCERLVVSSERLPHFGDCLRLVSVSTASITCCTTIWSLTCTHGSSTWMHWSQTFPNLLLYVYLSIRGTRVLRLIGELWVDTFEFMSTWVHFGGRRHINDLCCISKRCVRARAHQILSCFLSRCVASNIQYSLLSCLATWV